MFVLPQFPLTMGIYRMAYPYVFSARIFASNASCQLRNWGSQSKSLTGNFFSPGLDPGQAAVLTPPGTDLRDISCGAGADLLEVPAGSGRWYIVGYVDDVAKG